MDKNVFENAKDYILRHCDADDFFLIASKTTSHEIRFAQNAITQHMAGTNYRITLQVAYENKTGSATINQIDEGSLHDLIQTSQQIARLNQSDPEHVPSEPSHLLADLTNYSEETAAVTMEEMMGHIQKCVDNAVSKSANVSGMMEKHLKEDYIVTKNGFEGRDRFSHFAHSMTMKKADVETKVLHHVKQISEYNIDRLIEQLNSQFDALKTPEKLGAQKIPVILRPAAAWNFFDILSGMLGMREADEGITPFTGQLGKPFFGNRFTFKSVVDDPSLVTPRFSNEGLPAEAITWIDHGVISNLMVSRYYATQKKIRANFPCNFVMLGEDSTEQEMMKKVDRGLIINDFWYIRYVDRKRGELTGMTRDGVMYFENGKIHHTVNNFRWNEIPHEVTRRIIDSGKSLPYNGNFRIPILLIDDFNFVDTTTF